MTLAAGAFTVNGRDLSDYGLALGSWPEMLAWPDAIPDVSDVAGHAGNVLVASEIGLAARTITVTGTLIQDTTATTLAALDALKRRLAGPLEIRTLDQPGRYIMARLATGRPLPAFPSQARSMGARVTLTFTADDPYLYDVNPSVYAVATRPVPVGLGSAPSGGRVTLHGPGLDPYLVYRDTAGVVRSSLAFTLGLQFSDALVIEFRTSKVTLVQAGVETDGAVYIASGDLPVLDPADGDPDAPAWPTLEVHDTDGTVTGTLLVRRAWL